MNELTDLKNEYKYIYDTLCCVMRMPQNKKSSINSIFKYGHPVRKDSHPVQKDCFFGVHGIKISICNSISQFSGAGN